METLSPTEVANDTFVLHDHVPVGVAPGQPPRVVPVNTLLIRSARAVVVDTGSIGRSDRFLTDLCTLVDPADIGWVFVSSDAADHTGGLHELLALATRATVVAGRSPDRRSAELLQLSDAQVQWVDDGERIDVGDRTLAAVRPPVYDSPAARGLFDPTTGLYWTADSFATTVPHPVRTVDELEPDEWERGMQERNLEAAPWIELLDERKFQASVDVIEGLGAIVLAGCHTPIIPRHQVDRALAVVRRSTDRTLW
jgi:glyoxylase-like metal-dependent hydrolase (beta-lactamase superfamily II)